MADTDRLSLVGESCRLIPMREEDATERYIQWLNDLEVTRYLEVRLTPQTRETAVAFIRSFSESTAKYLWGIYSPGDERELMGTVTLNYINPHHGTGEIGLMIGRKEYWGKGVSNEAMSLVLDFAYETLGLRRVTGGSYASNLGMNFTFKRLGFVCEGKLRRAFRRDENQFEDGFRWGLLAEEWRARREKLAVHG